MISNKPNRRSFVVSANGNSTPLALLTVLFVIASVLFQVAACPGGIATFLSRCKYSVRDVAFVDVHGKSWQLQIVKPVDFDEQTFAQWNETLKSKLADSNIGFMWHNADSPEAIRLVDQSFAGRPAGARKSPLMLLTGPDETTIPMLKADNSLSLAQQIDTMIDSPVRQEILNQLVSALCVVLLVESDDEKDNAANTVVQSAIDQVNKQMWTMEKPTDNGPVVVRVTSREKNNEKWLLHSLGIHDEQLPAVAIVYGRGRRLGEVLTADEMTVKTIVGRASVCGQDCECDLNRDWLYGQQMIHVWSNQLERKAERNLSFDPNSAFVIAEVAQIIQKNSKGLSANDRINLGGGLVIHDLDSIDNSQDPDSNAASPVSEQTDSKNRPMSDQPGDVRTQMAKQGPSVPWVLFAGLFVALIAVSFWLGQRAVRQR